MSTPEKEMENTKELAKKLTKVVKVPKEQKEKTYKKLFINFVIAIVIFVYFFVLNMLFTKLSGPIFERTIHIISCVLVLAFIVEIEIAYRKDNDALAIHGIELFAICMLTIFMPYVFLHRGHIYRFLYSMSSIYIALYYSIKCFIIYLKDMKKYKDELSDVKEIVNDTKKESYLDKKSKRKFSGPVEEESNEVVEEKDSRIAKLEKMQERIRENQERRKAARESKKEKKEPEAVKQNRKERFKPIKEEKAKEAVKEEKIKDVVKEDKPKKEEKLEPLKEGETLEQPVKRKRGRPRKVKPEETNKE